MAAVDDTANAGLLAHVLPRVMETDEENERVLAALERLDSLPAPTPEEESFLERLTS